MKKIVLTIREDICQKNNKDPNAKELLEILPHYGDVVDFDVAVRENNLEYQTNINNLTAQLDSLKEMNVADDELEILKAYRATKSKVVTEYETKIAKTEKELNDTRLEQERRVERIKSFMATC